MISYELINLLSLNGIDVSNYNSIWVKNCVRFWLIKLSSALIGNYFLSGKILILNFFCLRLKNKNINNHVYNECGASDKLMTIQCFQILLEPQMCSFLGICLAFQQKIMNELKILSCTNQHIYLK